MAFKNADRVKETSTTTGTGTYNLDGAVTGFRDTVCKVLKSRVSPIEDGHASPGTIDTPNGSLVVACGRGTSLELLDVQLPNRKPCSGRDLVNGMRIAPGEKFVSLPR